MKNILLILTILFLTSCSYENKNTKKIEDNKERDFNTFVDTNNGYKVDFPNDWDTTSNNLYLFASHERFEDSSDNYRAGFNLTVFENEGLSLEEMVNENIKMAKIYYEDNELRAFKLINANGIEYFVMRFQQDSHNLSLVSYTFFFDNRTHLFTLTYMFEEDKYSEHFTRINKIIQSFDWLK